jgi:hypothetical protein
MDVLKRDKKIVIAQELGQPACGGLHCETGYFIPRKMALHIVYTASLNYRRIYFSNSAV